MKAPVSARKPVTCLLLSLATLALSGGLPAPAARAGQGGALGRASAVSAASPWIGESQRKLRERIKQIKDPKLRDATFSLIDKPAFKLADRRLEADAIRQKLRALELWEDDKAPVALFPDRAPMAFAVAPASPWAVHHAYPGGLVIHTLTNLEHGVALARNWESLYQIALDTDLLRAAAVWHDVAKTWTLEWRDDGTATAFEGQIAGTGAHHVLGIAEAIRRGFSPKFVVILASAHAPAHPQAGLSDLVRYLRAAATVAGAPFEQAGLKADGSALADPAPLESFLHHLSDHDWVGSEVSLSQARQAIQEAYPQADAWTQLGYLARLGDLRITDAWQKAGVAGVRKLSKSLAPKGSSSPAKPKLKLKSDT